MDEQMNQIRHERSKKDFPKLKLEDGEYVEVAISRAPLVYLAIWLGTAFGIAAMLIVYLIVFMNLTESDQLARDAMLFFAIVACSAIFIWGLISTYIFKHNNMYVTNKRITQFIMISPVISSVNVIDLSSIEDVSFRQAGILQKIFHYGTLRLSTVGDETTYTFPYTNIGPSQVAKIVTLVNNDRDGKKD